MKLLALAAVLAMGAPAIAQDMPDQDTMTEQDGATNPAPGQTAPPPPTTQDAPPPAPAPMETPPPADAAPPAPPAAPAGPPPAAPMAGASTGDPTGGYQPSTPPLSGSPVAGQQVIFRAAPPPDQAYPAPAPLAEYPVCKRGQTDKCRNPSSR